MDQAQGLRQMHLGASDELAFASAQRGPNILAVTSGKGGVGKTQVASNVAVSLAKRGRKVLLIDADVGLASVDLALGLRPSGSMLRVVSGEAEVADILCEGPEGLHLVPACPGRYELANLHSRDRNVLIERIVEHGQRYDDVVIDTGAGIGATAMDFASAADHVLLVTTPDPTALRDAYATAKVLHRRCGTSNVAHVANCVNSEAEGLAVHERLRGIVRTFLALEIDFLGAVPRDPAVSQAVTNGEALVLAEVPSPAARAMTSIAQRLIGRFQAERGQTC